MVIDWGRSPISSSPIIDYWNPKWGSLGVNNRDVGVLAPVFCNWAKLNIAKYGAKTPTALLLTLRVHVQALGGKWECTCVHVACAQEIFILIINHPQANPQIHDLKLQAHNNPHQAKLGGVIGVWRLKNMVGDLDCGLVDININISLC